RQIKPTRRVVDRSVEVRHRTVPARLEALDPASERARRLVVPRAALPGHELRDETRVPKARDEVALIGPTGNDLAPAESGAAKAVAVHVCRTDSILTKRQRRREELACRDTRVRKLNLDASGRGRDERHAVPARREHRLDAERASDDAHIC